MPACDSALLFQWRITKFNVQPTAITDATDLMRIFAMGGGGFTSAAHPSLDDFVLSLIESETKRIGYVGTASDNDPIRLGNFNKLIAPRVSFASVMPAHTHGRDAAEWVRQHDLIYVGGGDTAMLLQRWRATGLHKVLHDACSDGIILAGVSAGAVCWFESALVRGPSGRMEVIECLGFLRGSICAHFDAEPERKVIFSELIARGAIPPGVGVDDGVGVYYGDDVAEGQTWSAHDGSWAYRLRRDLRDRAVCSRLPAFVKG